MTDFNKVFVDTAPYIYFLNHNDNFYDVTKRFFEQCQSEDISMVTSVVTKEEYSVMPYKTGNMKWLETFCRFLAETKTEVLDIDDNIADKAAQIRAKFTRFKAMDSLQLASAIVVGADIFLTNDRQLKQFDGIKVIVLEDL